MILTAADSCTGNSQYSPFLIGPIQKHPSTKGSKNIPRGPENAYNYDLPIKYLFTTLASSLDYECWISEKRQFFLSDRVLQL